MVGMLFSTQVMGQATINLNGAKSAQECLNATDKGFTAAFSFGSIDATEVATEKGVFSNITMDGTYPSGNIGDPTLPAANRLIAVPYGANNVNIEVKSYSTTIYNLADYGIHNLYPQQTPLRKDQDPKDFPFEYNSKAYSAAGFAERPIAVFEITGTMRGIQVGALTVNPVQYDAANNLIRVYNNIEVEVDFGRYDKTAAYDEFARTFNPYVAGIYKPMFNERQLRDIYDDHPDLWQNPVKMLVIANRAFESTIQDWVTWKTEKGFYVDVNYTDNIGTSASAIKTFIQQKYATDAPTFLMIMGDRNMVPESGTGSMTSCVTDLGYSSVDGDMFSDMFHSRFPAENVDHMVAMINKALEYEQLTMPDPSYLSKVLLIAGEDTSGYGVEVGRPAIWYASNYYYNTEHGFTNVYEYSHGTYTGCYDNLSTGVGFANYTAHGSQTSWAGPSFSVSDVSTLTNEHKYFLAMGNCCQAADWGYSSTCFGEAMVRTANKGAYAYIGSCPSTYWYNDYYFAVGATNQHNGQMPDISITTMGCYDAIWDEESYNTVDAIRFIGNLASNAAEALGYTIHKDNLYDWQAYHTLGDGSILPFRVQPYENNVSHLPTLPIGMDTYTVEAEPGSYVGITKDGQLYGAGMIGADGSADIAFTPITSGGDVKIVVTNPKCVPYIAIVPAAAMEGPYIAIDSFTPGNVPCNEEQTMSITFKNVGAAATTGTTNVVLTCDNQELTIIDGQGSFNALAQDATVTLTDEFSFIVAPGVADGTKIQIDVTATCGSNTWIGKAKVTVGAPTIEFFEFQCIGGFTPGESQNIGVTFKNVGHYRATNAVVTVSSESPYVTIANATSNIGTIEAEGTGSALFNVTISADCPTTEVITFTFNLVADNEVTATGVGNIKNTCMVVFDLEDTYGDGWNGNQLVVSFSDGTPSQNLTISSGSSASYTLEIGMGTTVTLTWISGSYPHEVGFTVSYEGGEEITSIAASGEWGTPSVPENYSFEFTVQCGGAPIIGPLTPVSLLTYTVDEENRTLELNWTAPEDAIGFIITRDSIEMGSTTMTTFIDKDPIESTTYCVIAQYMAGNAEPVCVEVGEVWGVNESNNVFQIYPNPVSNTLNIEANGEFNYVLYNSVGQEMVNGAAKGNQQINVNNFPKGVYYLRVSTNTQVSTKKVMVE